MRLSGLLFLVPLVVAFLVCDCVTGSPIREIRLGPLSNSRRLLREERNSAGRLITASESDEERIGVKDAFVCFWNAMKIKVKLKFWLFRGITPDKVLEKLKVTSKTDTNYKYYSKYYFKYYVRYPGRQPPNLPTKVADGIMQARLHAWLEKELTPPQVFQEMGFTGTFASAKGDPLYKYLVQYFKMWSDLQIRLAKEADELMKARLDTYLEKNLTPPQVFKKLGLTGTLESARDNPDYKYFEQYSKMWSNLQVRLSQANTKSAEDLMIEKLYNWLHNGFSPPQVFKEMGYTGTFASASGDPNYKYFELYCRMWSAAQGW